MLYIWSNKLVDAIKEQVMAQEETLEHIVKLPTVETKPLIIIIWTGLDSQHKLFIIYKRCTNLG